MTGSAGSWRNNLTLKDGYPSHSSDANGMCKDQFYYATIYLPIVTICFTGGLLREASNRSKSWKL